MSDTPSKPGLKSLADYFVRYDLAALIEEARLDYSQSSAGGPRLLAQKDIAARFRRAQQAAAPKPRHE